MEITRTVEVRHMKRQRVKEIAFASKCRAIGSMRIARPQHISAQASSCVTFIAARNAAARHHIKVLRLHSREELGHSESSFSKFSGWARPRMTQEMNVGVCRKEQRRHMYSRRKRSQSRRFARKSKSKLGEKRTSKSGQQGVRRVGREQRVRRKSHGKINLNVRASGQ
eukprot:1682214-Pleurochrysis_carterae.AAC.1